MDSGLLISDVTVLLVAADESVFFGIIFGIFTVVLDGNWKLGVTKISI